MIHKASSLKNENGLTSFHKIVKFETLENLISNEKRKYFFNT